MVENPGRDEVLSLVDLTKTNLTDPESKFGHFKRLYKFRFILNGRLIFFNTFFKKGNSKIEKRETEMETGPILDCNK